MDKKTLKALKGSIKKWIGIRDHGGFDSGPDNCALCQLNSCEECIIYKKTGSKGCDNTPYQAWSVHIREIHKINFCNNFFCQCDICKKLANEEVKFLQSLLPKEKNYEKRS